MIDDVYPIAQKIRSLVISMSYMAKAPHLGSSLSCVDLLAVLYKAILKIDPENPFDTNRDRFILSKGHAATTLYAALATRGFISESELLTYAQPGSRLPEHPSVQCIPGVEAATGSLGHGLSLGLGLAWAAKKRHQSYATYVLISDGECNEGAIWEAALLAPRLNLNNLCVLVDFNKWQATGRSQEVMQLEPLEEKFKLFGWEAVRIDGHDLIQIQQALAERFINATKPFAIIADTIKGKGVSFMEDDNNWHYRIPSEEELSVAIKEINI